MPHVAAICRIMCLGCDKAACAYFVAALCHTKSNQFEFVPQIAATMIFTCHTRRFVAATCRGDVSQRLVASCVSALKHAKRCAKHARAVVWMDYSLLCTVFSGSLSSRQLQILGRYPLHQHPASRASFIPLYFFFLTVQSKYFGLNFWPFPEELALVDYPCLPIFPQRGQTREPYLNIMVENSPQAIFSSILFRAQLVEWFAL